MNLRYLLALVSVSLVGCTAAPAPPAATQPAAAPAPTQPNQPAGAATAAKPAATVRYGFSSAGAINGPLYIAESMGFLAEQGITLDYIRFPSASEVIPSITRDDVDVAGVGLNPATFNALAGNFGIKLVADTGTQFPGFPLNVVVVGNELANTIKGPADLKGRRIALTPPGLGTASGLLLTKYLAQANLTPNDVDIVQLNFPDQTAALAGRSVDVAFMAEPFATQAARQGIGQILTGTDVMSPGYTVTGMVYTEKFRNTKHDLAQGFMIAFLKGVRVYMGAFGGNQTNRDQVIQIMAEKSDIKDVQLWQEMIPTGSSPDGKIDLASIAESQAYFKSFGLVQNTPDPATLVDTSFAESAVAVLGPGQAPVPPKHA